MPCSEGENQCAQDIAGTRVIRLGVTDRDIEGTFVGVEGTCSPVPASEDWWMSGEADIINDSDDCIAMPGDRGWFSIPLLPWI